MAEREKLATVDLKVRMKEALRWKIEGAAREAGVSLNAEAVSRLEQSFDRRPLLAAMELAFGKDLGGMLIVAGEAMARTRDTGPRLGRDFSDPWLCNEMVRAAHLVLEAFRQEGEIIAPEIDTLPVRGPGAGDRPLLTLGREVETLSMGEYVARLRLLSLIMDRQGLHDPASSLLSEATVDRVKARVD